YIEAEWFAEVWRTNTEFSDAVTYETKRYVRKIGALCEPGLLAMLAAALTREEVLAFYEELRQDAPGRVMEWGAEFEKAVARLRLVLPVPRSELESVGDCLRSAVCDRDLDRVRFLVRCMKDAGIDPAGATFEEIDCGLSTEELAALSEEQWQEL